MSEGLLALARRGDLSRLLPALEMAVRRFGSVNSRVEMSDTEKLIDEALTYARLGDLDEATHRLRLCYEPKFRSEAQCVRRYGEAMREKRREVA